MNLSSVYNDASLKKVSAKWKKFKERGVSNLYLLKELGDDGVACAMCTHSVLWWSYRWWTAERLENMRSESYLLAKWELMAHSRSQMSGEPQILDVLSKLLNRVLRIACISILGAELYQGIVLSSKCIKSKHAGELACSAIAWGVKYIDI